MWMREGAEIGSKGCIEIKDVGGAEGRKWTYEGLLRCATIFAASLETNLWQITI